MAITFQSQNVSFKLLKQNAVRTWIKDIIHSENKQTGQLNFVFTGDEELLELNKQFLRHNTYTDIITFDSCEGKVINGDIIISVDRVKENAIKFKSEFQNELNRVIIHGVLHLCGYKDKTDEQQKEMRAKEDFYLNIF